MTFLVKMYINRFKCLKFTFKCTLMFKFTIVKPRWWSRSRTIGSSQLSSFCSNIFWRKVGNVFLLIALFFGINRLVAVIFCWITEILKKMGEIKNLYFNKFSCGGDAATLSQNIIHLLNINSIQSTVHKI